MKGGHTNIPNYPAVWIIWWTMLWDYFMERLLLLLLGQIYLVYHIGFVLQRMDYIYIQFKSISHTISTITIWDDDCNLVVEQVFLYPNPSQIHPKSIPKPSQNHPKSSQNHLKSIPKPSQIIPKPSQIIPNRPTFTRFSIPSSPAVPSSTISSSGFAACACASRRAVSFSSSLISPLATWERHNFGWFYRGKIGLPWQSDLNHPLNMEFTMENCD